MSQGEGVREREGREKKEKRAEKKVFCYKGREGRGRRGRKEKRTEILEKRKWEKREYTK